jgi:tetratricopeptide (TPR) repeat protein
MAKPRRKVLKSPVQKGSKYGVAENTRFVTGVSLVIAIFGFLLYANTLGHGYVLDDFSVIKENFVTKQGIEGIPTHFKTHARYGYWPGPGELYRPLPMTMFSFEWELAPDSPWFSHLINVILYALTSTLLFILLLKLFKGASMLLPLFAALFFVAHPVHTEVVANIKSRDEIVMLLGALAALFFLMKYAEEKTLKWAVLSFCSYIIALFSKESAVTFVAVFPLTLFFFSRLKPGKIFLLSAVYAFLALCFILIRKSVIGAFGNPGDVVPLDNFIIAAPDFASRLANAFLVLGKYLWVLLIPHPLCSDLGFNQIPLTNWWDWRVLISLLVWIAIALYATLRVFKRELLSYAILFFILNFSISSNLLLLIGTSYGERLLYAASPGFGIALAVVLFKIFREPMTGKKDQLLSANKNLWIVSLVILGLYTVKTVIRNTDWKDSYTLYHADISNSPNSAKLNFHYGLEIVKRALKSSDEIEKKADLERSIAHFQRAISIYPSYHDAYGQLGLAYYRERNYEKAMENYELAIKYKPNFPLVYSNMGIIFFENGDLEKAKDCYENAVKYDPRMVDARRNLGAVFAMQKNFNEAIKQFSEGLKYAPDDPTLNFYLGSAYRDSGREDLASPYLEKAYRLDPSLKK